MKDPRELAARALCRKHGLPENTKFEGKPMWHSYLEEVEVVLQAAGFDVAIEKERERCATIVETWHKDNMNQPLTFVGGTMKLNAAYEIAKAIRNY